MKHYGDITKLDGHNLPLVDIVTGGSPCQDLSMAGKRAGLAGERSGLFMEQVRIIKEMRDESTKQLRLRGADVNIRFIQPRYMVWENVPGAFSSNKGEDFRAVLEETAKIVCEDAVIPRPENGKWTPSGVIMGNGWSIAWRVHDAQFWGVPQRRKRIALVADFGGQSAPEILFERESVSGDSEKSGEKGQGTSTTSKRDSFEAISFQERAGKPGGGKGILIQHERTGALSTLNNQSVLSVKENSLYRVIENHPADSRVKYSEDGIFQTLSSRMGTGGGNVPLLMEDVYCVGNEQLAQARLSDKVGTLNCMHDQQAILISETAKPLLSTKQAIGDNKFKGVASTLSARDYKGVGNQYVNEGKIIVQSNRNAW